MRPRLIAIAVVVLAIGVIGYAYASPWLTVSKVRKAAAAGDVETVNDHVDFPALRDSLKSWVNAQMGREFMKSDMRNNPFAALGLALASKLSDTIVDAMVTPEGVRAMLVGQHAPPPISGGAGQQPAASTRPATSEDVETTMRYESLDRFVVTFRHKTSGIEPLALVWRRDGLAGWRLTAVRMAPAP